MKYLILGVSIFIGLSIYSLQFLEIPMIKDLGLNKNKDIIAGEGEVCINPYFRIECQKGLTCVYEKNQSVKNGICLKESNTHEKNIIVIDNLTQNDDLK